jgi:hypothetical protein
MQLNGMLCKHVRDTSKQQSSYDCLDLKAAVLGKILHIADLFAGRSSFSITPGTGLYTSLAQQRAAPKFNT